MKSKKAADKKTKTQRISELNAQGLSSVEIAKRLGVKPNYVYTTLWRLGKSNVRKAAKAKPNGKHKESAKMTRKIDPIEAFRIRHGNAARTSEDTVNHPRHYKVGGIETIDFIEAKQLSYNLGNVVKYVTRSGVKSQDTEIEDLRKAQWYLAREISRLQGEPVPVAEMVEAVTSTGGELPTLIPEAQPEAAHE